MDGASIHNGVTRYLITVFQNRWMGRFSDVKWPARSPDLNPLDYFYWPYLKSKVYSGPRINNIQELEQRILEISDLIPTDMILRSVQEFYNRLAYCTMAEGRHFEQFLGARRPGEDIVIYID